MDDKESYRLKKLAQIEKWKADLNKLKEKASDASEEIQLEMNNYFRWIGFMIDESMSIMSDFMKSSGKALRLTQIGLENGLDVLKSSIDEANMKLKQNQLD